MMLCYTDSDGVLNFCTIEEAIEIEHSILPEDGSGQIEATMENLSALTRSFGRVVSLMYKAGLLPDDMLLDDLLQGGYEICKD